MARRRTQEDISVTSLVVAVPTAYLIVEREWVGLGCLWFLFVVVWVAFLKKTPCDVQVRSRPGGCGENAYGRLRACRRADHKRAKRDALFALFGLSNPTKRWRILWARTASTYGRVSPAPDDVEARVTRPLYDATMLIATIAGSIATIIALVLSVI